MKKIFEKKKKNIVILIFLCLSYIPLFLVTLFVLGLSGLDYSCRFTDVICILNHPENLKDYLILYGLNLLFIVPIIKLIISISKIEQQEQQERGE